jgi:periplasmic divalent cation tolerance protein
MEEGILFSHQFILISDESKARVLLIRQYIIRLVRTSLQAAHLMAHCVVFTTAGSQSEAESIAAALIEARLAACVNLFAIQSVYSWQGEMQREAEWQLVIKTRADCFEKVEEKVRSLHSYEVPEIIAVPIEQGSADYLSWIDEQVAADAELPE